MGRQGTCGTVGVAGQREGQQGRGGGDAVGGGRRRSVVNVSARRVRKRCAEPKEPSYSL